MPLDQAEAGATRPISPKFYGLDVIRGVATCMVALAHVAYRTGDPAWGGRMAFGGLLNGLYIFVDFFFVLSGFLIAWVHWRDIGVPSRLTNYVQRRFSRIYPIYWLVLTLYTVIEFIRPSSTHAVIFSAGSLIGSYSLIKGIGPNLLGVAWTLYFEIIGYLFFAAMICSKRWVGFGLLFGWTVAIIIHYSSYDVQTIEAATAAGSLTNFYLHPYNLQFLMGILLATFLRGGHRVPFPLFVAGIGIFCFLGSVAARPDILFGGNQLIMRLSLGLFACMTIAGIVDAERYRAFQIPAWMQRFGAASYCIYLTHTICEPPMMKAGWVVFRHLPAEIWIFIVAGIAIGAGYVFHRVVELPLTEAVKRIVIGVERKPSIQMT